MRRRDKTLLAVEVAVCFAPATLALFLGLVFAPVQVFVASSEPLHWRAATTAAAQVACGLIGLATLAYVLGKLFAGRASIGSPTVVCIGVALGLSALMPLLLDDSPGARLMALLPLASSVHVLFLARRMLFSSWRDGLVKVAIATACALPLLAMPGLDPSRASGNALVEQKADWERRAPRDYEFTVQLSGYPDGWQSVEVLVPKRITVEGGRVVSAVYVGGSDGTRFRGGDPAPLGSLWTIDRIFAELLAAEERGWDVNLSLDEGWGFVRKAHAISSDGNSLSGWSLEVRDFTARAPVTAGAPTD